MLCRHFAVEKMLLNILNTALWHSAQHIERNILEKSIWCDFCLVERIIIWNTQMYLFGSKGQIQFQIRRLLDFQPLISRNKAGESYTAVNLSHFLKGKAQRMSPRAQRVYIPRAIRSLSQSLDWALDKDMVIYFWIAFRTLMDPWALGTTILTAF